MGFVFEEDRNIWKRITFDTIMSKENPIRRLAVAGARSQGMTKLFDEAQQSDIDKAFMFERLGIAERANAQAPAPNINADSQHSGSVAVAPGSDKDEPTARSRSRSPRPTPKKAEGEKELPEWVHVGNRVRYVSSSGKYCAVDIDEVTTDSVKIVFAEKPDVWKGIPVSMILSKK